MLASLSIPSSSDNRSYFFSPHRSTFSVKITNDLNLIDGLEILTAEECNGRLRGRGKTLKGNEH